MDNKNKEKILLTIACRGGSKGVKNKNIRKLCGLPLIAYTILQARRWGGADKIICSTDSDAIASIAKQHGADVPFIRPRELATDTAGKIDVLRHALKTAEDLFETKYDILIDLDATAPIRRIEDLDKAMILFKEKRPKSLFSVTNCRKNPYFNMVEVKHDGYACLVKKPSIPVKRRQDAPRVYDMNASIFIYNRDFLINSATKIAISDESIVFPMDEFSAFDIDNEIDFQFVEFLISRGVVSL